MNNKENRPGSEWDPLLIGSLIGLLLAVSVAVLSVLPAPDALVE